MTSPERPTTAGGAVHSMTGSGVARGPSELGDLAIELRAVNGRTLHCKFRLPPECHGLEVAFESQLRDRLERGTVLVAVDITRAAGDDVGVDVDRFGAAAAKLRELAERHGLGDVAVGDVLAVPGVVPLAGSTRSRTSWQPSAGLVALIATAIDALIEHRASEGAALAAALRGHLDDIAAALERVARRAPAVIDQHRQKLLARVEEFARERGAELGDDDVIREVALVADRSDIREEIDRLRAHLDGFRDRLARGGQVGRSLEFLAQEMLREINTIGSKSNDVEMAREVVGMKSAIDRVKEQAANVE